MDDNVVGAGLRLRPMTKDDVSAVVGLERHTYQAPWPKWFFLRALQAGFSCWVLDANGVVGGYTVMEFQADWAHLMNVCVAPRYQHQGWGQRLINHQCTIAREHGRHQIWLEVRPSNQRAIALYRQIGFRERGRRKRYYPAPDGREDALVMTRQI